MGDAREVMDRLTAAVMAQDGEALAACYAEDAVVTAPGEDEISGRDAAVNFLLQMAQGFPDANFEYLDKHESGDVAIDEGYFTGTNTEPLPLPSGETAEPTGRSVRLRACDVARVEGGRVTAHHFYWDNMEFLGQLGLLPAPDPGAL